MYFINQIEKPGGIQRIIINKANYLTDVFGYTVYVCYLGNEGVVPAFMVSPNVKLVAIKNITRSSSFIRKFFDVFILLRQLCSIKRKYQLDIVINANTPLLSWIIPFLFNKIVCILELHFSYDGQKTMDKKLCGKNFIKSFFLDCLRRLVFPKFSKIVALTEIDKQKWEYDNMKVIPNFIDSLPVYKANFIDKRVISVGRLSEEKGFDLLLLAWSYVKCNYPEWHLDIYGDGPLRSKLQKLICDLNLEKVVHLRGWTNYVESEYLHSSFYVMSSLYEGFPMVLLEAMSWGLPCISFNISGAASIIKDTEDGMLVSLQNIDDLAKAICFLIENEVVRRKMSDNAVQNVKRFERDNIMSQWKQLFQDCVNNKMIK